MTFILVLLTVVTVLAAQLYLGRRRRRIANLARARSLTGVAGRVMTSQPPPDYLFHPGHTWVRVHDKDLVTVGATDFAINFAGALAALDLPTEGSRLRQGERAWTLISSGRRRLDQLMPIDGKVIAVNRDLLAVPSRAQESPYEAGWLLRVQPRGIARYLGNLMSTAAAAPWLEGIRATVTARLSPALGTIALDGGEWAAGFGDRLEDDEWETLRHELFPGMH